MGNLKSLHNIASKLRYVSLLAQAEHYTIYKLSLYFSSAGSRPWDKGEGVAGGRYPKKFFRPELGPQFGLKIRGGPPLDPPLFSPEAY